MSELDRFIKENERKAKDSYDALEKATLKFNKRMSELLSLL